MCSRQDNLFVTKLAVTSLDEARAAAQAAVDRFGRIDVLINNAGDFYAGFFEEISPDHMRRQIESNLFDPMNVITLSSIADLVGAEFNAAYAASKVGVEGWMESAHTVPACAAGNPAPPAPAPARRGRPAGPAAMPRRCVPPPDRHGPG
ncbi:SDR family NAD(P)-dependent oxidoreductase [Streptomyces qaidamensis]|uniref:SDR family NAD(P)-dependent oxidoreductase n=1 Tax=Streptomyces qaidamensis TaxID=1783515 RepID=UPI00366678A3